MTTVKKHVLLRIRNFNSDKLKVNDANGNPIEMAAVVVWRVIDSAKVLFDVENYEIFFAVQSETAIRALATAYPYDSREEEGYDGQQPSRRPCLGAWRLFSTTWKPTA